MIVSYSPKGMSHIVDCDNVVICEIIVNYGNSMNYTQLMDDIIVDMLFISQN